MNTYTKRGRGVPDAFLLFCQRCRGSCECWVANARSGRLEREQHDLGMGPHAQRRTPRAGAPIRKDEHPAEAVQTVHVPAIYAPRDPGARRELPAVCMPANLERNPRFLGDGQPVRRMYQQNARPFRANGSAAQDGAEISRIGRLTVVHPDDLQAIELDFLVIDDAHSGL